MATSLLGSGLLGQPGDGPQHCFAGSYDSGTDGSVDCVPCPLGSACDEPGVTLASLPLRTGYYRTDASSSDLRRCPDFGDSSGCAGGVTLGEGPCKEWLRGPYCRLCNVTDR